MTIFDAPARRRRSTTPAHTLYDYWLGVLEGTCGSFVTDRPGCTPAGYGLHFGKDNHYMQATSSDKQGRPILTMAGLELRANGEFRIPYMRGWRRRTQLEAHTFLSWTFYKSRPQWFVDLGLQAHGYWASRLDLADYTDPRHYVDEHLLTKSNYYFVPPWLKLTRTEVDDYVGEWEITYSRPHETWQSLLGDPPEARQIVAAHLVNDHYTRGMSVYRTSIQETFDWYARLREKRRRLEERDQNLKDGTVRRVGRTVMTEDEIEAEREDAVLLLVASMEARMPARTVPLRKPAKEDGLWPVPLGTR